MKSHAKALSTVTSKSLARPSVSVEPGDQAFDHPAAAAFEALGGTRALDDFNGPSADPIECGFQFGTGIAAIGEDMTQPREETSDGGQQCWRSVTVLNSGGVNGGGHEQAVGIAQKMALASLDARACVVAAQPIASRTAITKPWLIRSQVPSSRQR